MTSFRALTPLFAACLIGGSLAAQQEATATPASTQAQAGSVPAQAARGTAQLLDVTPRVSFAQHTNLLDAEVPRTDEFVLEAGEHALANVIERTAAWLGRNYLMSEADFQQTPTVKLQSTRHFGAEDLERTLGQLLYTRGFAVVEIDAQTGLYEVIAMFGPRRAEVMSRAVWRSPDEIIARRGWYEAVATNVTLGHLNAQMASNALRPYLSQSSSGQVPALTIGTLGESRSLVLTGFGPQLAPVIEMIRLADRAAGEQEQAERVEALQKRVRELEQQQPQALRSPASSR